MVRGRLLRDADAPGNSLTVELAECTDSMSNQLRWCVTRDIPTLALARVQILQTSPFPDEYIAHRVALMPFAPVDPAAASAAVQLDVRRPGRVLAHQIQGGARALTPNFVVATLPSDCSIRMSGELDVGFGKDHQRYNHVACARVSRRSEGMPLRTDECWCQDTAPGSVCPDCAGTKCADPSARVNHVLYFETFGVNAPEEVLRQAILITRAKLCRIATQLGASKNRANDILAPKEDSGRPTQV